MKRSQMIRKLVRHLRDWEGSRLDATCAREIIDLLEANGMLPPGAEKDKITFSNYATKEVTGFSYDKYEWEPERNDK